ncbi:Uncharacterized protein TCM_044584 [Theobroma cacao]|uniref:Uncharacterized protein n=1 Tax=Theobroma cacao TaxID=3641 RepID=A0A061FRB6_THECC|nr:Uncharacterized protein TCM_044584 [Theobroma cacao]
MLNCYNSAQGSMWRKATTLSYSRPQCRGSQDCNAEENKATMLVKGRAPYKFTRLEHYNAKKGRTRCYCSKKGSSAKLGNYGHDAGRFSKNKNLTRFWK